MSTAESDAHSRELLKDGLHRQVLLERRATGHARVVKRYRSKGFFRRALDGRRARREHRLLQSLWQAGVPVPRPLGLCSSNGAWELSTELIEGAASLDDLLELREPAPAPPEHLAEAVGCALAAGHARGLDHRDLHAGNLLLDPDARCWLVDFGAADRRARLEARDLERDLVSLAAATRERASTRLRQRALLSWVRSLPTALRAELPPPSELAERVERAARGRRVAVLLQHRDRWLRASGRCRRLDAVTLWTRLAPLDPALVAHLKQRELPASPQALEGVPTLEAHLIEAHLNQDGTDLRESFAELGRAYEHALPALWPLALRDERPVRVVLGAPRGSRALRPGELPESGPLARLRALLADRGLRLDGALSALWRTPEGALLLGPGTRLDAARAADGSQGGQGG